MLVSAVSASSVFSVNSVFNNINTRGADGNTESVNSLQSSMNRKSSSDSETKLFDSINEWKRFCYKQIAEGKLDVIA